MGDGTTEYAAWLVATDKWNGLFTLNFLIIILHSELFLNVKVYSFDADSGTYEYRHIPQSPFLINLEDQNIDYYCKNLDMIAGGFGYTRRSTIVEQPI